MMKNARHMFHEVRKREFGSIMGPQRDLHTLLDQRMSDSSEMDVLIELAARAKARGTKREPRCERTRSADCRGGGGATTPAGAKRTFWWTAFAARLREVSRV